MNAASEMVCEPEPELLLLRPAVPQNTPWPEAPQLANHPIAAELDVPGRLRIIETMAEKYGIFQSNQWAKFERLRQQILARQHDSRLFLGVVGEFSSGKSTLVNALIRERLLRSDVLQGTTAAATIISYGPELKVEIRKKGNGDSAAAPENLSRSELLALIHQATSDEAFARDVVQVDVCLPSPTLQTGIVIVDTPGPNATNERHGEVTGAAIRQLCDAAIIVVPANAAGTESLFDYLQQHAKDILHRCIFLITKVDLLRRAQDRTILLDNVRKRLTHQLAVCNPRVLIAAPQFVVEHLRITDKAALPADSEEPYSPEEILEWLQHFEGMERDLHGLLMEKRLQAQADDVARFLELLYAELDSTLQSQLHSYHERHEKLTEIVIPDIEAFIAQKRDHHFLKASRCITRNLQSLADDLQEIYSGLLDDLRSTIENASSVDDLKSIVDNLIPSRLRHGQRRIQGHIEKVTAKILSTAQAELGEFHDDFQRQFRDLATLGGVLEIDDRGISDATNRFGHSTYTASTGIAATLQSFESTRGENLLGGGAMGAMLGTFVLPGVGTIIGGALGTFISSFFAPSLDELRAKCWEELCSTVLPQLEDAHAETIHAICTTAEETVATLGQAITEYAPKYQHLVQQMRERDADEQLHLLEARRAIEKDLASITAHKQSLESTSERIRAL